MEEGRVHWRNDASSSIQEKILGLPHVNDVISVYEAAVLNLPVGCRSVGEFETIILTLCPGPVL